MEWEPAFAGDHAGATVGRGSGFRKSELISRSLRAPESRITHRGYACRLLPSLRGTEATKQSIFPLRANREMDCFRLPSLSYGGQVASPAMTLRAEFPVMGSQHDSAICGDEPKSRMSLRSSGLRARSWSQRLTLMLVLYVGNSRGHFLEGINRLHFLRAKIRPIGQILQQHNHGVGDLP